jgi:Protein of unknown function (DUF3795)
LLDMDPNDLSVVAYCGLCCLDCHGYSGKIADLARDLRKELRTTKYDKFAESISAYPFAKAFINYPECYELLGQMVKFRCRKGCRNGGGPPFCNIRKCCRAKNISGCWLCETYEQCEKLDFLNAVHGDSHRKNLAIIKKKGIEKFIRGKRYW